MRDVADCPILRVTLNAKVDVLLTSDKDFLESGVTNPKIMTVAEFIEMWSIKYGLGTIWVHQF